MVFNNRKEKLSPGRVSCFLVLPAASPLRVRPGRLLALSPLSSNATLLRPELSPDAHRSRVTVSHPKLFGSGLKFSSVSRGSPCGWSLNHRLAGGLQSRGCPGILRKMLHACVHECFSGDKGHHILQILKHACDPKDNVNSSQAHPTSTADPLA